MAPIADLVLGDENVLAQRVETAVVRELLSAIVCLGRLGEHLHDDHRIEKRVDVRVFEARLATDGDDVRIRVHPRGADPDAHVADVRFADPTSHLRSDLTVHVTGDQIVAPAGTRHGEDAAGDVLAPDLGLPLEIEVFGGRHEIRVGRRHQGIVCASRHWRASERWSVES